MKTYILKQKKSYKYLVQVPELKLEDISKCYLNNINKENVLLCKIEYEQGRKKSSASFIKEFYKEEVVPYIQEYKIKYILICDADYFKVLAKVSKTEPWLGYILDDYLQEGKVLYLPSFKQVFYDPVRVKERIQICLSALHRSDLKTYEEPGKGIIHSASYPRLRDAIEVFLKNLLKIPKLTCDIEAFSLKHPDAGIGTITFCWNKHEGVAFPVDYVADGTRKTNEPVRDLLRWFFQNYQGTLIFHNIAYDVYILIYQLYMKNLLDTKGLLNGLNILLKNWEDTKLIAYLATNSCSGNNLSLKYLAQEYCGNYAQEEIGDITKIPLDQCLEYNLTDGLATWFVYEKYWDRMIQDNQLDIYQKIFKESTKDIIQMQLTGLPLDMNRVLEVEKILQEDQNNALSRIVNSEIGKNFTQLIKEEWVIERNKKLKTKKVTLADCKEEFNPNSNLQLQKLLYKELSLPVIEKTTAGAPATNADVFEKLVHHTKNQEVIDILQALIDYKAVNKILTAFIPSFKNAYLGPDGWHYLFGNFNLGGTVSGRLSSSGPNLQQIPATGSKYAKIIKSCFKAPEGWLFIGLDFNALEDHISALTTKDKNKLKVYIDHYDGHCLRAYSYWKSLMPDITEALKKEPEKEVEIINSIKSKHKDLRQRSKGCTFALTYAGTYRTLMKNFGFSEEEARHIEKQYHELYKESDEWVQNQLNQASKNGYVTCAFGLRVRTPLLKQVIRGTAKTPHEAEAEGRTAGNALGQSWCLINNRAGIEFNNRVRQSKYANFIKPCAQIHDAQYFLIKDDINVILWTNKYLVKAVQWQNDPIIWHDKVHLGGEVSIFFPDWAHELVIPNECSAVQLESLVNNYLENLNGK